MLPDYIQIINASDFSRSSGEPNNTEDENKENISPFPEPDRNGGESTPVSRDQQLNNT